MKRNLLPLKVIKNKIKSLGLEKYVLTVDYATDRTHKYKVKLVSGETVNFGHKHYEDFLIHGDEKRRENYRNRHRNDKINDITKPGFWSYRVLW
jgi:hypothetical protein